MGLQWLYDKLAFKKPLFEYIVLESVIPSRGCSFIKYNRWKHMKERQKIPEGIQTYK